MNTAELAARALELAKAGLADGAEVEALASQERAGLTRFANSYVHQHVAEESQAVTLRVHLDGRTATASTSRTDDEGLRVLVDRLAAAARLLPPDPQWPGLTAPEPPADGAPPDPAILEVTPAARTERVKAFVDATSGLLAAGYCSTGWTSGSFVNSAGHSLTSEYTEAAFDGVARAGTSSTPADGVARHSSPRLADIDGAVLGARAAAKARASVSPAYLPPGDYEVVLEPEAVSDILGSLAYYCFNGKAFTERQAFAQPGVAQFDPALSVVDDPTVGGLPFDREGTPKRRLDLVRDGVTTGLTHNRRTAVEVGATSTGHALPGDDTWGPIATNLTIEPVGDGPTNTVDSVAALVAQVERGLLVTDIWYTRVLDPRPLIMTGLTRNGVWLIENGEIAGPVRNLRFTQAYPQALAPGRVLGIGSHAVSQPAHGFGFSAFKAPALRLASWRFTGGAEG
ncbi:TldD/PmbA family protein [Virgisporangium ochraceum]|uniref:Peptidase U62 n=1 Tax=Virgisporangium ochraceum TaxID=65505 RepID=A0A8J4EC95_9ACTN|nr:TldD/PmbA family protein [Virgisporangium ochraceum]GIJ70255.1 peptidase U62 [Virgisporangium ochraceum]